jgi:hypothetical protein
MIKDKIHLTNLKQILILKIKPFFIMKRKNLIIFLIFLIFRKNELIFKRNFQKDFNKVKWIKRQEDKDKIWKDKINLNKNNKNLIKILSKTMLFIAILISKTQKITRIKKNNLQIPPKTKLIIPETIVKQNKIFTANNGNNLTKDTKNFVNKNKEHNSVKELQIDHHFKNISMTYKREHDY